VPRPVEPIASVHDTELGSLDPRVALRAEMIISHPSRAFAELRFLSIHQLQLVVQRIQVP